ncbi:MAG: toxin-antitoxin system YwqK family antitoxin, partial [Bacteroidia bacterium]
MKKIGILLFTFLLSIPALAGGFYEQLCAFNPNWKKYAHRAPEGAARNITSDREYVQAHLGSVLGILRTNSTVELNSSQLNSRMQLIELLNGYRLAGQFPLNYYRRDRIPVFIDEHNTHCAVGYLLMKTGHENLAQRIAATDNYIWVKDIKDPEVLAWQQTSGLTLEELKLIQGAYDSYLPNAFTLPNKNEIPQKPAVILAYFEDERTGKSLKAAPEHIWLKGEGIKGILHGKWIQNFAVGIPWIVGWFENGKKTGQWKEYYQGTSQLCRTEIWRNDKLNGLRIRYDRTGKVIEEILFREGKVVTKTNYSPEDSLTWIRRPLNDSILYAEVYNSNGALIGHGKEKVYNPGNLQWFQNIELTALNTAAIHASSPVEYVTSSGQARSVGQRRPQRSYGRVELFGGPQLVQYLKEGTWTYYKEYNYAAGSSNTSLHSSLMANYKHFAPTLIASLNMFEDFQMTVNQDSILVEYSNDQIMNFYAKSVNDCAHLKVNYYSKDISQVMLLHYWDFQQRGNTLVVKDCGQYNLNGERIGEGRYFNNYGQLS